MIDPEVLLAGILYSYTGGAFQTCIRACKSNFWHCIKNHIYYSVWVRYFVWNFKGIQKILPHPHPQCVDVWITQVLAWKHYEDGWNKLEIIISSPIKMAFYCLFTAYVPNQLCTQSMRWMLNKLVTKTYFFILFAMNNTTKPLPEPMLVYHWRCSVAFIWEQCHMKCP